MTVTHEQRMQKKKAVVDGKIAEEGGPELADRLEAEGYDRYVNA